MVHNQVVQSLFCFLPVFSLSPCRAGGRNKCAGKLDALHRPKPTTRARTGTRGAVAFRGRRLAAQVMGERGYSSASYQRGDHNQRRVEFPLPGKRRDRGEVGTNAPVRRRRCLQLTQCTLVFTLRRCDRADRLRWVALLDKERRGFLESAVACAHSPFPHRFTGQDEHIRHQLASDNGGFNASTALLDLSCGYRCQPGSFAPPAVSVHSSAPSAARSALALEPNQL